LAGIEPLISGFPLIALIFHNQRNQKNQQSNQRFRQQDKIALAIPKTIL